MWSAMAKKEKSHLATSMDIDISPFAIGKHEVWPDLPCVTYSTYLSCARACVCAPAVSMRNAMAIITLCSGQVKSSASLREGQHVREKVRSSG